MVSESKASPTERLMRKRLAARLRQQRCRARKKELSLAKKQREQQDAKSTAHVPAQTRKPILVPRNHAPPSLSRAYVHQSTGHSLPKAHPKAHHPPPPHGRPHHQQPHLPHPAHRTHAVPHAHPRPHQRPQSLHAPLPPPPPPHHHHRHPQSHYGGHRPVRPLYMTEPPTRTQSIGSVVSFDDGSCPAPKSFDGVVPPSYLKHENLFKKAMGGVPTVSPTMSSKPIVEPDTLLQVPSRSPTKEETAIDAMLSLRSASFGV